MLPWFQRLVWKPFLEGRESAMISLFSKIMWRSSKVDVAEEVRENRESNRDKQKGEREWGDRDVSGGEERERKENCEIKLGNTTKNSC